MLKKKDYEIVIITVFVTFILDISINTIIASLLLRVITFVIVFATLFGILHYWDIITEVINKRSKYLKILNSLINEEQHIVIPFRYTVAKISVFVLVLTFAYYVVVPIHTTVRLIGLFVWLLAVMHYSTIMIEKEGKTKEGAIVLDNTKVDTSSIG